MWIGQCLNFDSKCQDLHFQGSNAALSWGTRWKADESGDIIMFD
jgi:hypothetical protein